MEFEEHFYTDDPAIGHPDVRTRLPDTDYFFLGNGYIHAAVQICRSGEGTPVGLLVMSPEGFGPKRAALTLDPQSGLEDTMAGVRVGDSLFRPDPEELQAQWESIGGVPAVRVSWRAGPVTVVERFFCPCRTEPRVARRIEVRVQGPVTDALTLHVGSAEPEERSLDPHPDGVAVATLIHQLPCTGDGPIEVGAGGPGPFEVGHPGSGPVVDTFWEGEMEPTPQIAEYWNGLTTCRSSHDDLDHLFSASRSQLPTAVDHAGHMDGSIWQYNLEWVRDQAHVAEALIRLGDHSKARTMLARLLDHFVSPDGDTVDSGRHRSAADVELDQNGEVLTALGTYVDWTGDLEMVKARWRKVQALASFPLQERFRHSPSGLLHNRREYWERHGGHGIEDGLELMSQFFVALGLERAAHLADTLGHTEDRDRWRRAAAGLRRAMLEDPGFRLIEEGHLIKRRGTDGVWQQAIHMTSDGGLPKAIPLLQEGLHLLDPDTSSVLPVAHAFIDPRGELARKTLTHMEEVWNQRWEGGGYGRYHASSEPDSPGAWPFASLFVARAYAEAGEDEKVWRVLRWLVATPGGASGAWFENDGPRIAPPYPQVGFPPWIWAELITLFVHHLLGVRPDSGGVTLRPRLLEGLQDMKASLFVRGYRLHLSVRPAGSGEERGGLVDGKRLPWGENGVRMPLPESDVEVEVFC